MPDRNLLFHGDNLEVLRGHLTDACVDLCYIDPPFHSNRKYRDTSQTIAFSDVWAWGDLAAAGYEEIMANNSRRFPGPAVDLIRGLRPVTGDTGLLAYLVSITQRVNEIHRVLKPTGSFLLHCDPTASHYLKLVLDAIFCSQGGAFQNEIVWCYSHGGRSKAHFGRKHDIIFFYSKSQDHTFNGGSVRIQMKSGRESFGGRLETDENGRKYRLVYGTKNAQGATRYYRYYLDEGKVPEDWWADINSIQATSAERLGYPTQKPLALLERIVKACSNPGDVVLDAYCGGGTTLHAAQKLGRRWIGIDITHQSIVAVQQRLGGDDIDFREVALRIQ